MTELHLKFKTGNTAKYKFCDSSIGNVMNDLISHVLSHGSNIAENEHGSFPQFDNLESKTVTLRDLVNRANKLGVSIPEVPDVIDVDTLNRVHEGFHLVEEQFQVASDIYAEQSELRDILREINNVVHNIEAQLMKNNSSSFWVFQIGMTHFHKRKVIDAVTRQSFRYHVCEHPGPGLLTCGYATIGKNFMHCVVDNDVELIREGHVRPQCSISTETIWNWHPDRKIDQGWVDGMWQKWLDTSKRFVEDNNLSAHIGYLDPIHLNSIQPAYAYPIGDCETWDINKWYESFAVGGIDTVEIN